ncbi:unnamed protein product [Phytophthora fragariaefolia]|uniref:Unnamed protein product n=1 Tax=Phytophthora fragariaefolia TaxID=1490495 RepID=A0A9W7CX66_9STRA|nr:unnamed protein product [Phytophthora fragariaefolia]
MMACNQRQLTPRRVRRTLSQLYYYKGNGRLSSTAMLKLPHCVEKEMTHLNNTGSTDQLQVRSYGSCSLSRYVIDLFFFRRVCVIGSPDAASVDGCATTGLTDVVQRIRFQERESETDLLYSQNDSLP